MVYVPAGPFTIGDPDPKSVDGNAFYRSDAQGNYAGTMAVKSEDAIPVGRQEGALFYKGGQYAGDALGPVPAAFPKGTRAFYVMKYEILQGQYATFLNAIGDYAAGFRASPLALQVSAEVDEAGRIPVDVHLRVRGAEAIYAAGDVARAAAGPSSTQTVPMSCQCAIPLGEEQVLEMSLSDISLGGICLVGEFGEDPPALGTILERCSIRLGSIGTLRIDLCVRNSYLITLKNGTHSRRTGCQFLAITPQQEAMVQRYIILLEQQRKAKQG
jgi:hypothetical protein